MFLLTKNINGRNMAGPCNMSSEMLASLRPAAGYIGVGCDDSSYRVFS